MTPTPITLTLTPKQASDAGSLIEAAGKAIGAQSWAAALELLTMLQQGMQQAAEADQQRIQALAANAQPPEATT